MSKLPLVLRELHRSEIDMARDLLALADRHRVDHEIFHVARDIATWSQTHVRRLADAGAAHGVRLNPQPRWEPLRAPVLARRASSLLGRRREPGLLLLADLRRIHQKAAGLSLDWELLGQAAQAMKQGSLLELVQACHPQVLRQMRWANAQLKVTSPQVIAQ